ncbi:nitronate monooxygenase [Aspergillus udagawae]|nr:nitronate monooxygenase [Aspergillus udagawae]
MSGAAASDLAIAVTRAGGLGQIGFMDNRQMLSEHLKKAQHGLQDMMKSLPNPNILPIGVGIIVFGSPVDDWMSLFSLYKPAVVWLSFASTPEFTSWTRGIRRATPETKVWIQLGSVTAAVEVAEACRPDALVIQGSDAGGHGHQDGASIVSLIPEVADALREPALALGASGVVMGTRFLAARETRVPDIYRDAILHASDGASTTARSRIFDDIWGPNFWPMAYDGRCLRNKVYEDYRNGVGVDRIRTWLYAGARQDGSEPLEPKDTGSIWAGTGVGLVKKVEGAADIVQEVRDDARARLSTALSSL